MLANRVVKAVFSFSLLVLALTAWAAPDLDSVAENMAKGVQGPPPAEAAQEITSRSEFRREDPRSDSNWLNRALERIGKLFEGGEEEEPQPARSSAASPIVGQVLYILMWAVLAGVVILLIALAIKNIRWRRVRKKAISTALLGEDEPVRSADEWLTMADDLMAEGKFREAARCLYLACLMRCDEYRVARFVRTQTNWEHAHRIADSPVKPESFDIYGITGLFDRAWYGFEVRDAAGVAPFRTAYEDLIASLDATRRGA